MKILPYEKFTLISKNSASTVFLILGNNIKERKFLNGLFKEKEYFEGEINTNHFNVNPIYSGRNSFIPIINGAIIEKEEGSLIVITMKLHIFTMVFGFLWFSGVISFLFAGIKYREPALIMISSLFIIFGGCLFIIPFKHEAKKAKNKLIEILEAEELDKNNLKGAL